MRNLYAGRGADPAARPRRLGGARTFFRSPCPLHPLKPQYWHRTLGAPILTPLRIIFSAVSHALPSTTSTATTCWNNSAAPLLVGTVAHQPERPQNYAVPPLGVGRDLVFPAAAFLDPGGVVGYLPAPLGDGRVVLPARGRTAGHTYNQLYVYTNLMIRITIALNGASRRLRHGDVA